MDQMLCSRIFFLFGPSLCFSFPSVGTPTPRFPGYEFTLLSQPKKTLPRGSAAGLPRFIPVPLRTVLCPLGLGPFWDSFWRCRQYSCPNIWHQSPQGWVTYFLDVWASDSGHSPSPLLAQLYVFLFFCGELPPALTSFADSDSSLTLNPMSHLPGFEGVSPGCS